MDWSTAGVTSGTLSPQQLDAYCARCGLAVPSPDAPRDAALLAEVVTAQALAIAFEDLDVWLRRPFDLSLAAVVDNLENNGLLFCVLTTLGFTVALRHARTWARCESYSPSAPPCARQHMVLVVKVGAIDYLCDVGLGAGGPAAPLALDDSGVETPLCGELFRLQRGDPAKGEDSWLLWAVQQGAWRLLHSFEHVDQSCPRAHPADFLMCSFFMQFAPGTLFRTQRYISKPTPGGRALLLFRELRLKGFERVGVPPTTQVTRVDTPAQLVDAARDHFNVELPLQDAEALLAAGDGPLA